MRDCGLCAFIQRVGKAIAELVEKKSGLNGTWTNDREVGTGNLLSKRVKSTYWLSHTNLSVRATRKWQKVETKIEQSTNDRGLFWWETQTVNTVHVAQKNSGEGSFKTKKKTSLIGVGWLEAVLSCSFISSCAVIVLFSIQNFLILPYCCTNLITIWAIRWKLKRNDFPSKSVLLVTKPLNGFGALIA